MKLKRIERFVTTSDEARMEIYRFLEMLKGRIDQEASAIYRGEAVSLAALHRLLDSYVVTVPIGVKHELEPAE